MKTPTSLMLFVTIVLLALEIPSAAQSDFQNLGFESATIVPIPGDIYGRVQFADAFPGWTAYVGSSLQGAALYNSTYLDSSGITIIDHNWQNQVGLGVIDGNYAAILQAGVVGNINNPQDTTISQTGIIPGDAKSLFFKGFPDFSGAGSGLNVTLGGQRLSMSIVGSGSNYYLYGADIQAWAGQVAELDITALASRPHLVNNFFYLDSVEFSNFAIPEPAPTGLLVAAALLFAWRLLRHDGFFKK